MEINFFLVIWSSFSGFRPSIFSADYMLKKLKPYILDAQADLKEGFEAT